jgi:hypothetical protein
MMVGRDLDGHRCSLPGIHHRAVDGSSCEGTVPCAATVACKPGVMISFTRRRAICICGPRLVRSRRSALRAEFASPARHASPASQRVQITRIRGVTLAAAMRPRTQGRRFEDTPRWSGPFTESLGKTYITTARLAGTCPEVRPQATDHWVLAIANRAVSLTPEVPFGRDRDRGGAVVRS